MAAEPKLHGVTVIGVGRIGLVHATNVLIHHSKLRLCYLVATTQLSAQKALKHLVEQNPRRLNAQTASQVACLGAEEFLAKLEESPSSLDFSIAVLATPTTSHAPLMSSLLKANKHILAEKPLDLEPLIAVQHFTEAVSRSLGLVVGYHKRFDDSFLKVRDALARGKIGALGLLRITSRDHPPPPTGFLATAGTFFDDFSIHDINMARWLVATSNVIQNNPQLMKDGKVDVDDPEFIALVDKDDDTPSLVYGCASQFLDNYKAQGVDDTAVLSLRFQKSGILVLIENCRRTSYGYDQRLEALGTNGTMLNVTNQGRTSIESQLGSSGTRRDAPLHSFPERYAKAYFEELNHLVEFIEKKKKAVRVTAKDCSQDIELCHQIQASRVQQFPSPSNSQKRDFVVPNFPVLNANPPIGCCILGIGRMGEIRARAILANVNARLITCYDIDTNRCQQFATRFGCRSAESITDAISDPQVQAVFVCTISGTHLELITRACKEGRHVFSEKPIGLNVGQTEQCILAAQQSNVLLYCGFQRRHDLGYVSLSEKRKDVGGLELIRITSRDASDHNSLSFLASSGGYWYDSLIHDFDAARFVVGEDPFEVFATGSSFIPQLKEIGELDAVTVVLRYPSGAIATIDNNRRAGYGYDQRMEIFGSVGYLSLDNQTKTSTVSSVHSSVSSSGNYFARERLISGMERYADAYEEEVHHFFDVLTGRVPKSQVAVTSNDIYRASKIADAAIQSFKTGGRVQISYD